MSGKRKPGKARFLVYRYALNPMLAEIGDLFQPERKVEDIRATKNDVFKSVLLRDGNFDKGAAETTWTIAYQDENFFLYKVAVNRSLRHERKDFSSQTLDNWPSVYIAVWNDPVEQLIAIQERHEAFQHPETILEYLLDSIREPLRHEYLSISVKANFVEKDFWKIVQRNRGKITSAEFQFVTPNMPNISANVRESLKALAKTTNSRLNNVKLEAPESSSLVLEQNNPEIAGLVEYSSKGGGDIKLKMEGVAKKWTTAKSAKEISIDKVDLEGPADEIARIMKDLLANE